MAGEKIATRVAYGQELLVMAEKYPNMVVLDADLSSATNTNAFAKKYPERFYNCGIAEQNMTCIAAGMSTTVLQCSRLAERSSRSGTVLPIRI